MFLRFFLFLYHFFWAVSVFIKGLKAEKGSFGMEFLLEQYKNLSQVIKALIKLCEVISRKESV